MTFRRRRKSIFDIFEDMFRDIEELFEEELEEFDKKKERLRGPFVYGIRMEIGPDGIPRIEEFGNIRRAGLKPKISEEREPLVDVFENDGQLVIVAELPGVDKDKIDVKALDDRIIIRASDDYRKYYKEVELPKPIKPETAKAHFKNGVLEIKAEIKKEKGKEEGVSIKVE
jgi:HSP20 family protein